MSRLSNLLQQVETQDSQLATDLKREMEALSGRRAFGLNFERHIPETVELPHRPVRRGDKVWFLPERVEKPGSVHRRLWRVVRIRRTDEARVADLVLDQAPEAERQTVSRAVDTGLNGIGSSSRWRHDSLGSFCRASVMINVNHLTRSRSWAPPQLP